MQINIDVKGLKELQATMQNLSDRRINAIAATALTRTAKQVQGKWTAQIVEKIDRPVARTANAVGIKTANAQSLEATVYLKDRMNGTAPSVYLAPQEFGGKRLLKKFEQALVNSGAMPAGFVTVPGKHAARDGYGNVSRAQLVAVIRGLGEAYSPGYARVISASTTKRLAAQAKHGRKYVAVTPADAKRSRVTPGIYERMPDGSRKAIFIFKAEVSYKRSLSLLDRANVDDIRNIAQAELGRAVTESLARLAAKGSV